MIVIIPFFKILSGYINKQKKVSLTQDIPDKTKQSSNIIP